MNKKLTTKRKLSDLKPHPNNPRTITPDGMKLMEKSLTEFRKMLTVRPVVIDEKNTILGGHQKVEAAKKLGWKEIEVRKVEGWSEAKKKAFLYKDNIHNGDWDWEKLFDWPGEKLEKWGLEIETQVTEWQPPKLERNLAQGVIKGLRVATSGEEQYRKILEGLKRPDAIELIEQAILGHAKD